MVCSGFKALPLRLNESSTNSHTVYMKEHVVRDHSADKPAGRTLFVVNVPPYVDRQCVDLAFSEAGPVQSVQFFEKPNSTNVNIECFNANVEKFYFKVCYVVFKKVAHLDKALSLKELQPVNSDQHLNVGVKKWINQYNETVVKPKDLKNSIEMFMKRYDENTKKEIEEEKQLEQEDDEGWITVTKRGKVNSFARTEKVENKIMAKEETGRKKKELKNFYTFQIRESKMKRIVSLRQKFEEDKEKILQIKQSRRFKPF